jgi:hypothetical protein
LDQLIAQMQAETGIRGRNIMKTITLAVSALALASLVTASMATGDEPATSPASAVEAPPAIPATPAAVDGIIYARKFALQEGYSFRWCQENPEVTSGYLLVLEVDPDLVFPRQRAEPVLYVGNQTAERLNIGYRSGHVVAIAPGEPDLTKALIWFGTPELPERVDQEIAQAELALARAAGIEPFPANEIGAALARGSEELKGSNIVDVLRVAADLVRQYSPAEEDRANIMVPAPRPAPEPVRDQAED